MKTSFKRLISLFLAAVTAVLSMCVTSYADTESEVREFGDYLGKNFEQYNSNNIDITSFVDKYGWSYEKTHEMIAAAYYSHPEFFFVHNGYAYAGTEDKVMSVKFEYVISKSNLDAARKKFETAAKKVVEGITDDMSDVDKALFVHDCLVLSCRYDNSHNKYSAYNCLVDQTCVCQGYTLAYEYILNELLGIPCTAVYSNSANHIWNYVKIGKNWYHVDLTLDDPLDIYTSGSFDRYGSVLHDNFLLSDSACRRSSDMHRNWIVAGGYPAATDTSYDNAFWKNVDTRLCYVDGSYYYTVNGGKDGQKRVVNLCRYDVAAQTNKVLVKLKCLWYVCRNTTYGNTAYMDIFSCPEYLNGKIYFNSNKSVYSYDISTRKVKNLFTLNKGEELQIYGMVQIDGKLRLAYRRDLSYAENYMKLAFK